MGGIEHPRHTLPLHQAPLRLRRRRIGRRPRLGLELGFKGAGGEGEELEGVEVGEACLSACALREVIFRILVAWREGRFLEGSDRAGSGCDFGGLGMRGVEDFFDGSMGEAMDHGQSERRAKEKDTYENNDI